MKKVPLIIGLVFLGGIVSIFALLSYSGMLTEFQFKGVEIQGPRVILCETPETNSYNDISSRDVNLSKIATIFFGTLKAYIALENYLTENKLSGMDLLLIADSKNDKLIYLFFRQLQEQ